MKKIILYFAAAATVAVACNKAEIDSQKAEEPVVPEMKMITETVSGSRATSTKATISNTDASFKWTAGDNIAVHVSNGVTSKYVFTSDEGASGASAAASSASFTVVYPEGYSRDAFAVYPSNLVVANAENYGQEGHALDMTLPSSYTLAQVTDETSPSPMIATNTAGNGWNFYQLCGLLRLTVNNIPASTKRLEINFDGKNVAGNFAIPATVKGDGTSTIALSNASGSNSTTITITKDGTTDVTFNNNAWLNGLVLNIPLPTGTYSNITMTAYDALTDGNATISMTFALAHTASSVRACKRTASFPVFSVSSTKKVTFAPGNLQYLGKADGTGTWRFAEHQYDFIGDGPTSGTDYQGNVTVDGYTKYNASSDKDVARDLFGWGTSGYNGKSPNMTSTSSGSYYSGSLTDTDYDWGVYHRASGHSSEKIINGGNYLWRLFTGDEWSFIMKRQARVYTRPSVPTYTETKDLYAPATVMGVKGIILFPDNWNGELDRNIKYGKETGASYTATTCDAQKWAAFEKQGCVFLPAAHVRSGVAISYQNEGHYWAGTVYPVLNNTEYRGGTLEFTNSGTVLTSSTNNCVRNLGQSVRLIHDVD